MIGISIRVMFTSGEAFELTVDVSMVGPVRKPGIFSCSTYLSLHLYTKYTPFLGHYCCLLMWLTAVFCPNMVD